MAMINEMDKNITRHDRCVVAMLPLKLLLEITISYIVQLAFSLASGRLYMKINSH